MKSTPSHILGGILLLLAGAIVASGDTVLTPAKRQEALERGKALVGQREIVPIAVDPFYPAAFAETVAGLGRGSGSTPTTTTPESGPVARPSAGPRTDRDLLQAMSASLKPSGSVVLGGEPTLLFGQKRVKAGGILTITFEGTQYTLEIVSIDRTTFTLRLNREEFTRNIK
jgi:hypothetical protein